MRTMKLFTIDQGSPNGDWRALDRTSFSNGELNMVLFINLNLII